ncbi:metallophosphoesterase [Latilactobacillus sakei]|uniref:metallophosphoesterase family protein n=1 Tax=Latilactobacillus sakei TaxID=1599 RepID=UPI0038F80A89
MVNEIKRDTVDYRDPTPFDNSKLQSLSEISKAIRHKTYGEDTREAMAQQGEALAKLMQETGGNQSAEVAAARGNFELLGIREDAQDGAIVKAQSTAVKAQSTANSKFDANQAESYLKSITAIPETFKNLNALKKAYPSGKNGLFVTADNGHKYIYYDGIWNDAGVYQSVGLAEDSVADNQLTAGSRDVMSSLNFDATKSAFADKFPRSVYLKIESGGLTASNGNETASDLSARSGFIAFEKSNITLINRGGAFQFQLLQYNTDRTFNTLVFGWKSNEAVNYTIDTSYLYRIAIANVGASTAINIDGAKTKFLITYTDEKLTYDLTNIDLINQSFVTIGGAQTPIFAETSTAYELIITLTSTEMAYYNGDSTKRVAAPTSTRGQSFTLLDNQVLAWNTITNSIYVSTGPFDSGTIILAKNTKGTVQSGEFKKYYDQASIERRINQQPSSYWDTYLDKKITEIQQAEQNLVTGDAFIFITDVHWRDNKKRSPALIEQIKQKTGVQKVFFGGDVPIAYGTSDKMMSDVLDFNNQFRQFKRQRDFYSVIGNHDFTIKTSATDDTGTTLPVSESYALFGREFERYTNIEQNKMYYYVDNSATKIRYIFINTEESVDETVAWGVQAKISQEQEDWLTNEALNVEDSWKIIAIGHVPIHPKLSVYSSKLDILKETFDGYNARTKLDITSVDGVTATTDFADAKGQVISYICGHNHKDESIVENNIVYISTGCDANYNNDSWKRTSRTTSEQLFDIFFYDTTKNNLKTIRIGAGEDRSWETLA